MQVETTELTALGERRSMAYEWDAGRARAARMIKYGSMLALAASASSVPVAVRLTASPFLRRGRIEASFQWRPAKYQSHEV